MIGPSGGSPWPQLWVVLFWATLSLLFVAMLVAGKRRSSGSVPAMNRTVRLLGVAAALCFVGYWVDSQDRREVQALFDDVVDTLEIDDRSSVGGGVGDARVLCQSENRVRLLTSVSGFFDHIDGPLNEFDVPGAAVEELEVLARRLEDDGWTVRRFLGGGFYRLWAVRADGYVSIILRPSPTKRYSILVTKDDCSPGDGLPVEPDGVTLEPYTTELDSFEP